MHEQPNHGEMPITKRDLTLI